MKEKKVKIIAVVNTLYTNTYDTIYYEAQKDKSIDFTFVVIPIIHSLDLTDMDNIKKMMEFKCYPYILGYDKEKNEYLDLKKLKPDIVLLQSNYDNQRHGLYKSDYLSTFTRVIHISYGSSIIDYNYPPYNTLIQNNTFQKNCWFIASENAMLAEELNEFHPKKYVNLGYLKCDKFLYYKNNPDFRFPPKDDKYKKIIAWKPRWTATLGASNFLKYYRYFINVLETQPDICLLFIEHPLLYKTLISNHIFSQAETDKFFGKLKSLPNCVIVKDDNFLEQITNADIFVGDYCSTIVEFALTKKPIIYCPTEVTLSKFGEEFIKAVYVCNDEQSLNNILIQLINGQDTLQQQRDRFFSIATYVPPNGKTLAQNFLDYIKERINKEGKLQTQPAVSFQDSHIKRVKVGGGRSKVAV